MPLNDGEFNLDVLDPSSDSDESSSYDVLDSDNGELDLSNLDPNDGELNLMVLDPKSGEFHLSVPDIKDGEFDLGVPDTKGQSFNTRQALLDYVLPAAVSLGYIISIASGGGPERTRLKCDHSGKYWNRLQRPESGGLRNTSSRLTGCPFKLTAKRRKDSRWHLNLTHPYHNHEATSAEEISGHSRARIPNSEQKAMISSLAATNILSRKIRTVLSREAVKTGKTFRMTSRDISNAVAKEKRQRLQGRHPINVLLDILVEKEIPHNYSTDRNGHITHLFFAFPNATELAKIARTVFIMDSTYKTNRFR